MAKKFDWLEKFAEEQAKKMRKSASTIKKAEQIIVSPEDVPGAQNGATVEFNGEQFDVVDANYSDEIGPGVVLQAKVAAYEGLEQDPMGMSMGAPATSVSTPSTQGQQYHYTKLDVQQTYDFDQDAQWGSSSADATAAEIAGENATDRTTVPGKFTKSPGLNAPVAPVVTDATATEDLTSDPTPTPEDDTAVETDHVPTADDVVTEDVAVDDVVTEDAEDTEEKEEKEEKVASVNRILARIQAKAKKQ